MYESVNAENNFFTNIGETRKEGYCGEVKTRHRKDVGGKTVGPGDSGGMPRQRSCQKSQSIKYGGSRGSICVKWTKISS